MLEQTKKKERKLTREQGREMNNDRSYLEQRSSGHIVLMINFDGALRQGALYKPQSEGMVPTGGRCLKNGKEI